MNEANQLFEKYKAGTCSPEELALLYKWFHHLGEDEPSGLTENEFADAGDILHKNMQALREARPVRSLWPRVAAAAAILLIISSVFYLRKNNNPSKPTPKYAQSPYGNDVAPGGNKAILTLSDGRKISLNDAEKGELAVQSGIEVTKEAEGQLVYRISGAGMPLLQKEKAFENVFMPPTQINSLVSTLFNIVETPRGGEYSMVLADGTRVWLNAASSLRYPAVFSGGERRVELQGEAYFEVAPNKTMPFRVESNKQVVEVLGTHFNIASYEDDESVKTTLVEGHVRVSNRSKAVPKDLQPGQQSIVTSSRETITVRNVDVEEAIAWKNGYFLFNDENIESIMRKVARWYNVDVQYSGRVPAVGFNGTVLKSKNISGVLKILELTQAVNFKVKGRRVIVTP